MSAAPDIRGLKRVCVECGTRFYDMNKRPIVCPNCKTEFSGEIKIKSRRGRVSANDESDLGEAQVKKSKLREDDELEDEDEDAEIVSLDDLDEGDDDSDDDDLGDLDVDEDADLDDLDDADLGSLDDLEPDADLDEDED